MDPDSTAQFNNMYVHIIRVYFTSGDQIEPSCETQRAYIYISIYLNNTSESRLHSLPCLKAKGQIVGVKKIIKIIDFKSYLRFCVILLKEHMYVPHDVQQASKFNVFL